MKNFTVFKKISAMLTSKTYLIPATWRFFGFVVKYQTVFGSVGRIKQNIMSQVINAVREDMK